MPLTCGACGRRTDLDLIPAVGDVLRCPQCADERPFVKPPLLIVTGTAGAGKSTLCARLARTIPGAVFLDADIHAMDLISVVPPNHDYPAFWRSMMRLAHELAQNNVVVVYFLAQANGCRRTRPFRGVYEDAEVAEPEAISQRRPVALVTGVGRRIGIGARRETPVVESGIPPTAFGRKQPE